MSTYIAILFLLLTLFLSWQMDKCPIHPVTIISFVWLFLLIGYNVVDHGLYPLSDKFYNAFLAWIIPFQITCLFFSSRCVGVGKLHLPHPATSLIVNRYVLLFVFLCIIMSLIMTLQRSIAFDPSNLFSAWRELSVAIHRGEEAPLSALHLNFFRVAQIGFVFCLIWILRDVQFRYRRLFTLLVLVFIVMGADKGGVLRLFFAYIGALYFANKLKTRVLIGGSLCLLLIICAVTFFRGDAVVVESRDMFKLIYIYLFSSLPAFDHYILNSSADFATYFNGDLVFKNFPFVGKLFSDNYNPVNVNYFNYEMVHVPLPTNVYTMMAGYWASWKWSGLIVGGFFHGCFWGYVYSRSKKTEVFKVLYVSLLSVLVFYFFHDFLLEHIGFHLRLIFTLFFVLYNPMFKHSTLRK